MTDSDKLGTPLYGIPDGFFTKTAAARLLGISRNTLYKLIRNGEIGEIRTPGTRPRIPATELRDYIRRGLQGRKA